MNLQKEDSTYAIGMKPFVYSVKRNRAQDGTNEWKRGCFDVKYSKNTLKTKDRESAPDYEWDEDMIPCYEFESEESKKLSLNTLTFSYTYEYDDDIVFFSYFQPYTLSDLQDSLFLLRSKHPTDHLNQILRVNTLCNTIAGNPCYVLTITSDVKSVETEYAESVETPKGQHQVTSGSG